MDVAFEILVPRGTAFVGMSFETPQFVWQGEAHPQGFPQAEFAGQFVVGGNGVRLLIVTRGNGVRLLIVTKLSLTNLRKHANIELHRTPKTMNCNGTKSCQNKKPDPISPEA